jgi:hypothetical protein
MPTILAGVLLAVLLVPVGVPAGEFYSWIDPSGTMVLTDDPGKIPPATERSPVAVYRYREPRGLPSDKPHSAASTEMIVRGEVLQQESTATISRGAKPSARDSQVPIASGIESEPAPVLIEQPDAPLRGQYQWMPLVAPIYVGNSTVTGFWCHRSVSSPVEAFTKFLRQRQAPPGGGPGASGGSAWRHSGVSVGTSGTSSQALGSGNYVYEQLLRERHSPLPSSPLRTPQRGSGHSAPQR